MKESCTFSFLIFSFICYFLICFAGCSDNNHSERISSTTPEQEQLTKSKFSQFVHQLRALPLAQRNNFVQSFLNDYPSSPVVEENGLACFYWYGIADLVSINGDIQSGWSAPEDINMVSCGCEKFL